jgi:magnesium transporter
MPDAPDAREPLDRLRELLEADDPAALHELLISLHPSDLADLMEQIGEDERMRVLVTLADEPALAAEALAEMEPEEHPEESLAALDTEQMAEIIAELADDDAADIIGEMDPDDQVRALASLPKAEAGEIRELMRYPEESAGGIMTTELVAVSASCTVSEAIDEVRRQAADLGEFYVIFVIDGERRLLGWLPLPTLVTAAPTAPVADLTQPPIATVTPDTDREAVARIVARYNLSVVPVVDEDEHLLGGVTFDDVIDIIEAENTEDILRLASVGRDAELRGGVVDAVRTRFPWLLVNLGTAFAAAAVYGPFQDTIAAVPAIAACASINAGMGGNGATQALAVTVRRLALSREGRGERWDIVGKELVVGFVNGLGNGIIAGLVIAALAHGYFHTRPVLGLIVTIAMWGNLVIAGVAGGLIPLVLEWFGVDPAIASSVIVTTFTDMGGFFLTFLLATKLLL